MKKILFALCGVLIVMFSTLAPFSASAVDYYDKCITHTKEYKEGVFRYLDEVYTKKYPELALRMTNGTDADKKVIKELAEDITKDCKTDKEKADAVAHWVDDNIAYRVMYSAFPMDALYDRTGNCLSYAILIQDMLRSIGIPAAHGSGDLGKMSDYTFDTIRNRWAGHAWCFAYVDDQWLLYDPLANNYGLSKDLALEEWYYFEDVESVVPCFNENIVDIYTNNSDYIPFTQLNGGAYYINGKFYLLDQGIASETGNHNQTINNKAYRFVPYQENCGYYFVGENPDVPPKMQPSEIFTNGWITYGDMFFEYAYENGVLASSTMMTLNGKQYFMAGGRAHKVFVPKGEYSISGGEISVEPGYKGRVMLTDWYAQKIESDEYTVTMKSNDEKIAKIDNDGYITSTGKEGMVEFELECRRNSDDGLLSMDRMVVVFEKQQRKLDFSGAKLKSDIPPSKNGPAQQVVTDSPVSSTLVTVIVAAASVAVLGGAVAVANKFGLLKKLFRKKIK